MREWFKHIQPVHQKERTDSKEWLNHEWLASVVHLMKYGTQINGTLLIMSNPNNRWVCHWFSALLTSGVSWSSLAASGGAVCNVLEVCYFHSGVGPETLLKPLHQSLYALLIGVQRWNKHTHTNPWDTGRHTPLLKGVRGQHMIYYMSENAEVMLIYSCVKKINEYKGCEMIYSVNALSLKEKWGHMSYAQSLELNLSCL